MNRDDLKLYLVTDRDLAHGRDIIDIVREAVAGGVTMVQLREKDIDTGEFIKLGIRLKAELASSGVPLIINDRVDVALACDADGVHIGQSDMPYAMARRVLGPDKIIGLSIENFNELDEANKLDVDYVAASPVFGTPTKTDTAEPWGLEGLAEFNRRSVHPTVAIGGMNIDTVADVMACGTDGVAVVSAIIAATCPRQASAELFAAIASSSPGAGAVIPASDSASTSPRRTAPDTAATVPASPSLRGASAGIPASDSVSTSPHRTPPDTAATVPASPSLRGASAGIPDAIDSLEISSGPHIPDSEQTNKNPDIESAGFVDQAGEKSAVDAGEDISSIGEFGLINEIKSAFSGILDGSANNSSSGGYLSNSLAHTMSDDAKPGTNSKAASGDSIPQKAPFGVDASGVMGIGDDCAVIPQTTGLDTLVSTDMLVEGSHFLMNDISPFQLGWKSAAVNISDIAAMGGRPVGTFLSFALPKNLPVNWVREFMKGYRQISENYGVSLLGGDTTSSLDRLCVNVTVVGEIASGTAKLRSSARVGDLICVTGNLGDSAGGLQAILMGLGKGGRASAGESAAMADDPGESVSSCESVNNCNHLSEVLIRRHYLPRPRVEEGLAMAGCDGVHAMMDISDGVASDLRHILEASGVRAEILLALLPVSEELKDFCKLHDLDPYELAASGGEDYELLFTVDPSAEPLIGVQHTVIGRIIDSSAQAPSKCCDSLPLGTDVQIDSSARTYCSSSPKNSAVIPSDSEAPINNAAIPSDSEAPINNAAIPSDSEAPINNAAIPSDHLIKWIGTDKDYLGFRHF